MYFNINGQKPNGFLPKTSFGLAAERLSCALPRVPHYGLFFNPVLAILILAIVFPFADDVEVDITRRRTERSHRGRIRRCHE